MNMVELSQLTHKTERNCVSYRSKVNSKAYHLYGQNVHGWGEANIMGLKVLHNKNQGMLVELGKDT